MKETTDTFGPGNHPDGRCTPSCRHWNEKMPKIHDVEWRGKRFLAAEGSLHPAYSIHTFDEEKAFREENWLVKPGDVVFDVGASYGAYALSACSEGASMVYAFEPEPSVCVDLSANVFLNGWGEKFWVSQAALWSKPGKIDMRSYAPHWPQHTISGLYDVETLDNVVANRNVARMNWLKIDVEGAEEEVIIGGFRTIERLRPKIIVEVHVFLNEMLLPGIITRLMDAHYDIKEVPRDPCVMLVATPR